jgi:hypothetical protein
MALPDPNGISEVADVADGADAFLEQSYLTYIIPSATRFSPDEILQQSRGGEQSVESAISGIEQRQQLFFGTRFARCSRSGVADSSCPTPR